jgi:hypothetical protein
MMAVWVRAAMGKELTRGCVEAVRSGTETHIKNFMTKGINSRTLDIRTNELQ